MEANGQEVDGEVQNVTCIADADIRVTQSLLSAIDYDPRNPDICFDRGCRVVLF
jgi:hypothetical protein